MPARAASSRRLPLYACARYRAPRQRVACHSWIVRSTARPADMIPRIDLIDVRAIVRPADMRDVGSTRCESPRDPPIRLCWTPGAPPTDSHLVRKTMRRANTHHIFACRARYHASRQRKQKWRNRVRDTLRRADALSIKLRHVRSTMRFANSTHLVLIKRAKHYARRQRLSPLPDEVQSTLRFAKVG